MTYTCSEDHCAQELEASLGNKVRPHQERKGKTKRKKERRKEGGREEGRKTSN
jgi:hypothetical protein